MTIARRNQFRLDVTPYYHCITRCVRRAFLCGYDKVSGTRYEHRKEWIERHLLLLSEVFCIEIAGYAVMSNHYHVVLYIDQTRAEALSDSDVMDRWMRLYKGPVLMQRYAAGETLRTEELDAVRKTIGKWREELTNISRFMGHLNQTISRRANREDDCRGRFWESRFKMQAILDLKALISTLCYVDLNPVRAGVAKKPEDSKHTSIYRRLRVLSSGLLRFRVSSARSSLQQKLGNYIPIAFEDYLALLDCTGRYLSHGKRGYISGDEPPILARLGLSSKSWIDGHTGRGRWISRAVGSPEAVQRYCDSFGQRWIWQTTV